MTKWEMNLKNFLRYLPLGLSVFLILLSLILNFGLLDNLDAEYSLRKSKILLRSGDNKEGNELLFRAIKANPLLSGAFVDLSEYFLEINENLKVEKLLKRARDIAPLSFALLWRIAIDSLWVGNNDLALDCLKTISKVDSNKVFDLSWKVFNDNELILANLVNENNAISYLNYLISKKQVDETLVLWEKIDKWSLDKSDFVDKYINFLIDYDRLDKAESLWIEKYGKPDDDSLMWNGGFERKPVQNGFGWRISQTEDAFIGYDWENKVEGNYSLQVIFDGKHNANFRHVSNVVPVKPDSDYIFSSYIKSDNLTTRNGILWEIACYPNRLMSETTNSHTGTNDWLKIEKQFHTPSDCYAVKIVLRRFKSDKLDRYISGNVWIDDVKLRSVN